MDSPPKSPVPGILKSAFVRAERSPFLTFQPVDRPWLNLIGVVALSAVLIVIVSAGLGLLTEALSTGLPDLVTADLLADTIAEGPGRLYREGAFLVLLATALGAMALAILTATAGFHRRPFGVFQWPGRKPSLSLLTAGFIVMALVGLALWPVGWLIKGRIDPAPVLNPAYLLDSRFIYAGVAAVMLLIAAAAEEIVFRGVLLRILGSLTHKVWLLVLINGLLFSLIHLDPDPAAFVARAVSGMVWTWAALRLGGIEFAIGAHWANNLLIALLAEPMSEAASVDQKIPAVYLIPELVIAVVIVIATEWIARRHQAAETA